jgi:hypothetical protein
MSELPLPPVLEPPSPSADGGFLHRLQAALALVNAHSLGSGYYFPAGRRYVVFEARRQRTDGEAGAPLADILNRLAVQICYCSVYGTDCDEVLVTTASLKPEACER